MYPRYHQPRRCSIQPRSPIHPLPSSNKKIQKKFRAESVAAVRDPRELFPLLNLAGPLESRFKSFTQSVVRGLPTYLHAKKINGLVRKNLERNL